MSTPSPAESAAQTVDPIVEKVATGEWSAEQLRQYLEEASSPRVERVTDSEVTVTFVDEPGDDTSVALSVVPGPNIGGNTIDTGFTPVDGTPFHVLTVPMRSDLRFSYVFLRSGPAGDQRVPDPFNPPPRFSNYPEERFSGHSLAALPDAMPLPWLEQAEAQPTPMPEPAVLASEFLDNERCIWVSMPPGEFSAGSALPFVIQLDGTPNHSAPSARDALVRSGQIRPCAVVLVDQLGLRRYQELLCNPAFSQMLVDELLPWLRDRYPLSADPADVALAGESYGGLCAGWTALHHPGAFGNAILQSPSCGYHPDLTNDAGPGGLLRRDPVPTMIADYLAADPAPVRIFHDVGELESSTTLSRWFDQVLTAKGYDTVYIEFAGGHDYAWWRGLFADALRWCFPPRADPDVPEPGQHGSSA